jgi:hypothetical protein
MKINCWYKKYDNVQMVQGAGAQIIPCGFKKKELWFDTLMLKI